MDARTDPSEGGGKKGQRREVGMEERGMNRGGKDGRQEERMEEEGTEEAGPLMLALIFCEAIQLML